MQFKNITLRDAQAQYNRLIKKREIEELVESITESLKQVHVRERADGTYSITPTMGFKADLIRLGGLVGPAPYDSLRFVQGLKRLFRDLDRCGPLHPDGMQDKYTYEFTVLNENTYEFTFRPILYGMILTDKEIAAVHGTDIGQ